MARSGLPGSLWVDLPSSVSDVEPDGLDDVPTGSRASLGDGAWTIGSILPPRRSLTYWFLRTALAGPLYRLSCAAARLPEKKSRSNGMLHLPCDARRLPICSAISFAVWWSPCALRDAS